MIHVITRDLLWKHLYKIRGQDILRKSFFDKENIKHVLYHQWQSKTCCKCENKRKRRTTKYISDKGWETLYKKKTEATCNKGYDLCPCYFEAREIKAEEIGLATFISIVHTLGSLNSISNGRERLKNLRKCFADYVDGTIDVSSTELAIKQYASLTPFESEIEKDIEDAKSFLVKKFASVSQFRSQIENDIEDAT